MYLMFCCHKKGICVAHPLKVSVQQAVSVDVPLPYSMVRGEQIELRGSVYNENYAATTVRFLVFFLKNLFVCV